MSKHASKNEHFVLFLRMIWSVAGPVKGSNEPNGRKEFNLSPDLRVWLPQFSLLTPVSEQYFGSRNLVSRFRFNLRPAGIRSARVAAQMGEPDRAIAALQKVLAIPYEGVLVSSVPLTPALLRLDPMFDPIRNDPRFKALTESSAASGSR